MISTTPAISRRQPIATQFTGGIAIAFLAIAAVFVAPTVLRAQVSGALFTSGAPVNGQCSGVDLNIYGSKDAVWLNGGPSHPNAAGLPPGDYCVQVTNPDGSVLGKSTSPVVTVGSDGNFITCYQLSTIVLSASSTFTTAGYDDALHNEYKVWISQDCTFPESASKTDNFKVREGGGGDNTATICVSKFYDANLNGVQDANEPFIAGWEYKVYEQTDLIISRQTDNGEHCSVVDAPDTYEVREGTPIENNWFHTTPDDITGIALSVGDTAHETFGNVCIGSRFANTKTLGFWSNKNGQNLETAADFTALNLLHLRNATGGDADFTGSGTAAQILAQQKTALNTFLLGATATNMANMLSAQLATMKLNVLHNFVPGTALVYAGSCGNAGLNSQFITVNALMAAAEAALANDGYTPAGDPNRATQECLKTALDNANNNQNFVESSPCPFSFPAN